MDNFYKQNGSYFTTSGKKIKDLTDLQTFAKAGGKEVSAPTIPQGSSAIPNPSAISNYNVTANVGGTLYGTPKSPMNSATFNAGQTPTPELPNSNPALGIYADRSAQDATQQQASLQKELDSLKAQRITDTQTALKAQQDNLKTIQGQKDAEMAGYDAQFDPLKDKAVGIYDSMLDSIKDTNYKELTQQKLDLTNDIVKYSQMMRDDLDAEASQPGLLSISTGRQNAIKENYTSKIAIAQAAQSAIDGNFNLAFDIMDRGASAIERLTTDRINFINSVQTLYSTKENTAISEVLRLTTEEKEGLDNAVKDAETKLANIQKNKETIMEIMQTNPIIANKAGLSLTDTTEQITEKLNKLYVANPQYTPENQEIIKRAMEKYIDAGISLNDSIATVNSKLLNSKIYQNEINKAPNIQTVAQDVNGNNIYGYYDTSSGTIKKIDSNYQLGEQIGMINGLPAFDTYSNNPGVTRSNRNNNPGNIKLSDYTKSFAGVIGVESTPALDGGNFIIFDSPESGINAIGQLLLTGSSYKGVTAEQAIKKYNGGGSYGASSVGLLPNQDFQSQIQDPAKRFEVAKAIAKAEGYTMVEKTKTKDEIELEEKTKTAEEVKANTVTLIDDLLNSKSLSKATGASSWLAKIPGTSAYSFGRSFEQLRDLLALGNIDKLKGAMSDKDIQFLRNSATKLSLGLSEDEFKKELINIKTKLGNPTSSAPADDPLGIL